MIQAKVMVVWAKVGAVDKGDKGINLECVDKEWVSCDINHL